LISKLIEDTCAIDHRENARLSAQKSQCVNLEGCALFREVFLASQAL
jgi:hypothetical protein